MRGAAVQLRAISKDSQMRDVPERMADRLIVALDVPTADDAQKIVDQLDGVVSFYKIGLWLLFKAGTDQFIDRLIRSKKKVFLDYKMFDIPETVSRGVSSARDRGISFVTVHGPGEIIKAAVSAKGEHLKVFTITVLTSVNDADVAEEGYKWNVQQLVERRVQMALKYGSDGIIASAQDKPNEIRRLVDNQRLLIATPGIRSLGVSTDDHKRPATPTEAIRGGADYIIMGRQILQNPRVEAERIIKEMEMGLS